MPSISGISEQEANQLMATYGPNEIVFSSKKTAVSMLFSQFRSVLVLLLLVASLVSFFLSDVTDALFILAIVLLNSILGFVQEYRAEEALAALNATTVSKSTVIREGVEKEIDSRFLVPGDVIKVEEGDKIPADAKLVSTLHLEVNEASLTGESLPVIKRENEEDHNTILLGTIVVGGRGVAVVETTGMRSRFGAIAQKLSEIEDEPTPLQKQLTMLGKQLGIIALLTSALVFLLGILQRQEVLHIFLTSISLAVAAVPEGLPAVITITLAIGVHRMARQKAIVRKMAAIETLGAATILATDKTGTITKNEMRVREMYVDGKTFVLPSDSSRLTDNVSKLLKIGVLVNTANVVFRHDGNSFDLIGDPTEGALLLAAHDFGYSPTEIRKEGNLVDEFSFDGVRKTMSVIWQEKESTGGKTFVYSKGAPEKILEQSAKVLLHGKEELLSEQVRSDIGKAVEEAATRGLRVIAMAAREVRNEKSEVSSLKRDEIESQLTFVGFAALSDPPREEVADAAREATRAGIRTIIITGDNELTANAIATEVGIITEGEDILTGEQLKALSDEELLQILPNVRIFARTTPEQKLRIVKAYQKRGDIVCVTGDGVNDALALKQANVGVAMGITGTDVAKEEADVVVTDDNYATIVKAIAEGRTIYDNIMKSVVYLASGNLGEILTILGAVFLNFLVPSGFPLPLTPIQILWINVVTDGLPALALASDPKNPHIMRRKPRNLSQSILAGGNLRFILFTGSGLAAIVLSLFALSLLTLSESQARGIAFTTLIVLHVSIAFLVRGHARIFSNRFLLFSYLTVLLLQFLILIIPPLQRIFAIGSLW